MRSWVVAVAAVVVALLGGIGPAAAHSTEVATDPAKGATLAVLPQRVTITLNEKPMDVGHGLVVTGPDGVKVSADEPVLTGHGISVPVVSQGPAGEYTVGYRVVSADGHVVSGSYTFTVTSGRPAQGAIKETTTAEDENSVTFVFAVFSVVMMVAFVGAAALLIRRHSHRQD